MAINRLDYGDRTLIDLTQDTVTPETLLEGETAHNKAGAQIRGKHVPFSGRYDDLKDKPQTFPPASHTHGAASITSGTFGGQVNAAQGWQAPGAYLLRNSKLSAVDENPTANGQVCVGYGGAPSKTMIGSTIYPVGGGDSGIKVDVLYDHEVPSGTSGISHYADLLSYDLISVYWEFNQEVATYSFPVAALRRIGWMSKRLVIGERGHVFAFNIDANGSTIPIDEIAGGYVYIIGVKYKRQGV